jgi:hypothetical protein
MNLLRAICLKGVTMIVLMELGGPEQLLTCIINNPLSNPHMFYWGLIPYSPLT